MIWIKRIQNPQLLMKAKNDVDNMNLDEELLQEIINEFKDMKHDGDTLH